MPQPLLPPPLPPPRLEMPLSRSGRGGVWISILLHLFLLLLIVEITEDANPWPVLTPRAAVVGGGGGEGGGARQITMINLPPLSPVQVPESRVVPPRPVPVTRVVPREVVRPKQPEPVDSAPRSPSAPATETSTAGAGTGTGGGTGAGVGPGTGSGAGPGTGTAPADPDSAGSLRRPPEPTRVILPPFDYPRSMRGQSIDVNFFVLADGRVDRVVFIPDVPDRAYARKLQDAMRAYRFRPARDSNGQPVPGVAIVKVSF